MLSNHGCAVFSYLLILYYVGVIVDAKIHLVKDEPENLKKELLRSLKIDEENRLNTDKVIAVIENPGLAPRSRDIYRREKKIKVKLIPTNHKPEFVTKILHIIKKYYEKKNKANKKLCHRHFGSIMDAKLQKYRCLNNINGEETQEKNVETDEPKKFVDETRSSGREERLKRHKRTYFHNPLIQIDTSSTNPMKVAINFVRRTVKPKKKYIRFSFDYYDDTRKFGNDVSEPVNLEEKDETDEITRTRSSEDSELSSSDDDSSDSEDNESPTLNKDKIQEHGLKNNKNRFEIVDNLKGSSKQKNYQIQAMDREISSAEFSEEITEKPLRNVNKKNYKNVEGYGDGVKNKFIYVQGPHRMLQSDSEVDDSDVTASDSDEETKRSGSRLSHFLPKRYIWDSEEFNDLGYFWFNGPQGMYPRLRLPH